MMMNSIIYTLNYYALYAAIWLRGVLVEAIAGLNVLIADLLERHWS